MGRVHPTPSPSWESYIFPDTVEPDDPATVIQRKDILDVTDKLDGENCTWSNKCIGLPSVLRVGERLALFYDAPGDESISHMRRNIGLAWLELPLSPPTREVERQP